MKCTCGAPITETQAKLSQARRHGALPACKDCVTLELTQVAVADAVGVLEVEAFDRALSNFLTSIRELLAEHFAKNLPNLKPPTISVDPKGKKYLRIVQSDAPGAGRSVYCFVDKASGDILKAEGWSRPAKHARGNIFQGAGKSAITPYGVHYLPPGIHATRGRNR